ncbi:MAG: glycosyltransferase family 2 protein [Gemmataceae bacterium]|nr:glycosyltransferase family 2 protein [Gemmataceae bacterium]
MAKPAPPRDPVTVVLPVHDAADRVEKVVPGWADALARLGREYEIVAVDDGSTDATRDKLEAMAGGRVRHLRVLHHDARRGYGACLRTALAEAQHPLFFYTAVDYPYPPADLKKLLDRIDVRDELLGRQPDLISGCRTGRPAPAPVVWLGRGWRAFWRVAAGMQLAPAPAWPGLREYLYNAFAGWAFGSPLADVNSAYKLYRTAFLRRFPIQSDGDFVHTELAAKATFLTSLVDELPLTPAAAEPPPSSFGRDLWRVFQHPDFGTPPPAPTEPAVVSAVPDARSPEPG